MGLLDKLWDDTVAGPRPESGLGKLRKHSTFAFRSSSGKEEGEIRPFGDDPAPEQKPRVTRTIMIKKPAGCPSPGNNGTPPASPAGSTPPVSPFSGGGGSEWNRFRRKSSSDAFERAGGGSGTGGTGGGGGGGRVVGFGPWGPTPPHEV